MKKIQKEEKSYYDVFVAYDGTEFRDKEDCKKYESSAYAILDMRYRTLILKDSNEECILGYGCCEDTVHVIKVKNQAEADMVMQLYLFINSYLQEDANKNEDYAIGQIKRVQNLLDRSIKEDDVLIIGRGYNPNESFWFMGTSESLKEQIDDFCTPDKEDDNA